MEERSVINIDIEYDRFGFRTITAKENGILLRSFLLAPGKEINEGDAQDMDLKNYKTVVYTIRRPGREPVVRTVLRT